MESLTSASRSVENRSIGRIGATDALDSRKGIPRVIVWTPMLVGEPRGVDAMHRALAAEEHGGFGDPELGPHPFATLELAIHPGLLGAIRPEGSRRRGRNTSNVLLPASSPSGGAWMRAARCWRRSTGSRMLSALTDDSRRFRAMPEVHAT